MSRLTANGRAAATMVIGEPEIQWRVGSGNQLFGSVPLQTLAR